MQESEENDLVSSTSSSSSSSCRSPETTVASGTPVSLQGEIWMEMKNAIVLNVDWRGKNFAGTLLKADDSNVWGPPRPRDDPRGPRSRKVYKTWKKFNTSGDAASNRRHQEPRKRGIYCTRYPRSFVDSSNIVESKLRYGRDKRVAAYSSCPSSPRSSGSRTDGSSDPSSSTPEGSCTLKRSTSFSLAKGSAWGKDHPSLETDSPISCRQTMGHELRDTGSEEVCSSNTTTGGHGPVKCIVEDLDGKLGLGCGDQVMPSLPRMDVCNSSKGGADDRSVSFRVPEEPADRNMPSLRQRSPEVAEAVGSFNLCLDDDSDLRIDLGNSRIGLPAGSGVGTSSNPLDDEAPGNVDGIAVSPPASSDEAEKTYITLENCDLSYLQFPLSPDFNELSTSNAQFSYSSVLSNDGSENCLLEREEPYSYFLPSSLTRPSATASRQDYRRRCGGSRQLQGTQSPHSIQFILGMSMDDDDDDMNATYRKHV